jgi:hypothetical protein
MPCPKTMASHVLKISEEKFAWLLFKTSQAVDVISSVDSVRRKL